MTRIFYLTTFIIILLLVNSCHNTEGKKYKKQYYQSGKLKGKGYYISDTIPVDTVYFFYENGNTLSIELRDDSGFLNGETKFYYENGQIQHRDNYISNVLQGYSYIYTKEGLLDSKVFFLNDQQVGDVLGYGKNGQINYYGFLDFENHNRNLIKWDTAGKVIEKKCPLIFVDSINPYNDKTDRKHERSYYISLLIANPPKCSSFVKIDYVSVNKALLKRDSIIGNPFYFKKEKFPDSLFAIKILGYRYDSVSHTSFFQEKNIKLDYEQ